eukprot:15142881-Alexandrium_andersonii.AAC.1
MPCKALALQMCLACIRITSGLRVAETEKCRARIALEISLPPCAPARSGDCNAGIYLNSLLRPGPRVERSKRNRAEKIQGTAGTRFPQFSR